jgi:uncharacterized protein (DUF2147 family)
MINSKALLIAISLVLVADRAYAESVPANIAGTWETDSKNIRMEILQEGETAKGKILWGDRIVEADGVTSKKDTKNPDASLRSRDVVGITNLTGLRWNGKEYVGGKFYAAPTGRTFDCKLWTTDDKTMHIRVFLGSPLAGRTTNWHRYIVESH